MLSSRVVARLGGVRGLLSGAAAHPRNDVEGHPPPPVTQLSEHELHLKDTVSRFSNNVVKPLVREMDDKSQMHQSVITGVFENGFMGIEVPEKYGGPGSSFFDTVLVVEGLAKIDPAVSVFVDVQNTLIAPLLMQLGTEEQKQKYLPKVCNEWVGSFCLSEPGSGSDAFALATVAKPEGDDFAITGSKMWITNAGHASFFLVFANADPSKGYKGITCFLVDRNQEGVTVAKKEDKLGIRASSTCSVFFENVRVPKTAILGEYGKGYKYAIECLNAGRIGIGAQMIGLAQGCFDATILICRNGSNSDHALRYVSTELEPAVECAAENSGMQHQISQAAVEIEAARLLVYNAARMKVGIRESSYRFFGELSYKKLKHLRCGVCRHGRTLLSPGVCHRECFCIFLSFSLLQVACSTASKCVEWLGGVGFTKEYPVEKYYRDAKIGTIYEGTSNIQLNTIAKLIDAEYKH
ncbi:acyl-CoA dehydrogenase, middle domain protein [Ostertagia ostertagi]